jgi:hypothetical protein
LQLIHNVKDTLDQIARFGCVLYLKNDVDVTYMEVFFFIYKNDLDPGNLFVNFDSFGNT